MSKKEIISQFVNYDLLREERELDHGDKRYKISMVNQF